MLSKRPRYTAAKLNGIQLGNEIKCCRCNIVKNKTAFASSRLVDLAAHAATIENFNPKSTAYIPCSACTGKQVTELQCSICDKWKGLDAFSRVQRRARDDAVCWPCMEIQLEQGPAGQSSDEDDDQSDESDGEVDNPAYSGDEEDTSAYISSKASTAAGARLPQAGGTAYTRDSAASNASRRITPPTRPAGGATQPSSHPISSATNSTGARFAKVGSAPRHTVSSLAYDSDETDQHVSSDED